MTERATYVTLVGMVAYAAIATDLYLPAIPAMVDAFGANEAQGQLTLSIFYGRDGGRAASFWTAIRLLRPNTGNCCRNSALCDDVGRLCCGK